MKTKWIYTMLYTVLFEVFWSQCRMLWFWNQKSYIHNNIIWVNEPFKILCRSYSVLFSHKHMTSAHITLCDSGLQQQFMSQTTVRLIYPQINQTRLLKHEMYGALLDLMNELHQPDRCSDTRLALGTIAVMWVCDVGLEVDTWRLCGVCWRRADISNEADWWVWVAGAISSDSRTKLLRIWTSSHH